ncbi:hypothetical protein BsWGS_12017 [Bradybaena similaris]
MDFYDSSVASGDFSGFNESDIEVDEIEFESEIDASDISVSSVHTSDLSDFEEILIFVKMCLKKVGWGQLATKLAFVYYWIHTALTDNSGYVCQVNYCKGTCFPQHLGGQ